MRRIIFTTVLVWVFHFASPAQITLKNQGLTFMAGDTIVLRFQTDLPTDDLTILLMHNYGLLGLQPQQLEGSIVIKIPEWISIKTGIFTLTIRTNDGIIWQENLQILPMEELKTSFIEAYCGPKHLVVGIEDKSMIIATVLDQFDNPYPMNTPLIFHYSSGNKVIERITQSKELFGFMNFTAPLKSGFGEVSVSHEVLSSKAFRLDYYANVPIDYFIVYDREHGYGDGNQLITFETSTLKDKNGNHIGDGTLVYFSIKDNSGSQSIIATTIVSGKAKCQVPAPYNESSWKVSSHIYNYARSNELTLQFQEAISDIPIQIHNNKLTIGPIKSYMGQWIKDGTLISIKMVSKTGTWSFTTSTKSGLGFLDLSKSFLPVGNYSLDVQVANIEKSIPIEL